MEDVDNEMTSPSFSSSISSYDDDDGEDTDCDSDGIELIASLSGIPVVAMFSSCCLLESMKTDVIFRPVSSGSVCQRIFFGPYSKALCCIVLVKLYLDMSALRFTMFCNLVICH